MKYAWQQPQRLLSTWTARGVGGIVLPSIEEGTTLDSWIKEAELVGMRYVLPGTGIDAKYYTHPNCIGVLLEPDEPNSGNPGDASYTSPGVMLDASIALRAKTNNPVWLSLSGWNFDWQTDALIAGWCACADVISFDLYVINRGMGPAAIPKLGEIIQRLTKISGKPIVCDVECSGQNIQPGVIAPPVAGESYRCPTVHEMIGEVETAIYHGAEVLYFSHVPYPTWQSHDGTTPELSGAMTALNS